KQAALETGLQVLQPMRLCEGAEGFAATMAQLAAWQPDVMVVVAYGLILPRAMLELPRLGCLNIHASLLPRWRGAAPIQRAILAGDAESGVSIMQMDEGLDTGAVLTEERVPIGRECIAGELHDVLAEAGARQILLAVQGVAAGTLAAKPQPPVGVTHAQKLAKSEARIDWTLSARQIDRQVRAFNPWPVAETTLGGEVVKLLRSRTPAGAGGGTHDASPPAGAPATRASAMPGTVLGLAGDALQVQCGEGVLEVLELQRAGRKAVAARDFMNALQANAKEESVFN